MEAALTGVVANSAMGLSPKRHLRERNLGKIATSDTRINRGRDACCSHLFGDFSGRCVVRVVGIWV